MNGNHSLASKFSRIAYRIILSTTLAVVFMWLATSALNVSGAGAAVVLETSHLRPQAAFARFDDPVVITGARFPAFSGAPLTELVVYAYRGGEWAAIPFQIDEVNISGTFVTGDDGLLGDRDELVFIAGDAGNSASAADWPANPAARLNPRYAITVSDLLSASQQAWAYLYRSPTLTRSNFSYITWTSAAQIASAVSYTAIFSPTRFVGLSDLFINGRNADILDRQKTRLAILFTTLNEESLVSLLGAATITLPVAGPVRAATNSGDLKAAFYGSRLDFDVTFNLGGIPFAINSIRTSFDWISPTLSGIQTYYDSNTPGGVPIDGAPDAVAASPRLTWFQVNGDAAGPGGLVMSIPHVNPQGGTVTNYYKDNGASDSNDTGDRRSFGDAGLFVNNPGAVVTFTLVTYILPPGTDTNVGAAYYLRANNPLQSATAQQCHTPSGDCVEVKVPPARVDIAGPAFGAIGQPYMFTLTVTPINVTTPITYVYRATDQADITHTSGRTDSVTFMWNSAGAKIISATASNEAGLATTTCTIEIFVPPTQVTVTGATVARVGHPYTYVASVSPLTVSLPLTYLWQATDYAPVTVAGGLRNSATFTWTTTGFKHISVTAYNRAGVVTTDPLAVWVGRFIFLPLALRNAP